MNEKLDPEEVEGIMSRIKAEAVRIVEEHGGIVNQFVGDEVLALFGIPTAHEDDPHRAVKASLELHQAVRQFSWEVEGRIGRPLRMHTGIHTGLIVTNLRDTRDGIYGVTGDTVNYGSRLKTVAEDDKILVSSETQRRIAPFFETEALPSTKIKGKAESIVPHLVVRESGIRTKLEAAQKRGFTPLTGRERELSTLQRALEKALVGKGQFVTVVGEAGLGKSRLLYEFRRKIGREEVTVLEGRCQSYGVATLYLPWLDTLRRGLHLREEDSPAQRLEAAVTNILAVDPSLEQYIPHFLHLLSIPSQAHALPENLKGEELKRAFEEALAAIVTLNTRHKPMVYIMEDWHWADESSEAALQRLLGLISSYALMVVVLYRPEYEAHWGNLDHHTPLVLKALDSQPTKSLVKSIFGARSLPKGFARFIYGRTDGNPFFIEEMCSAIVEGGVVRITKGKAVLTHPLENLRLPDTVQAVIRSRLDRLDSDAREALRLASVIGHEFARRILEQIHTAKEGLASTLEDLKTLELIQQIRVLPEAEYMFRHVITQQVTYETLLLQQRRELHGLVGLAIEALYPDRLEEHTEALAHHYGHSGEREKAIHYLKLAGDKAAKYFSLVGARKHYREAIHLLDAMEMPPERMTIRIDLTLSWAAVAFYSPSEEIINVLETSMNFAEQIQDETRLAKIIYWMGRTHFSLGDMARALSLFERCIGIAEALADEEMLALPYNIMGRSYWYTAQYTKGIEFLEKGIPMMERLKNMDEVAYSTSYLGILHCWTGDFPRAFPLAEKALEIAKEFGNLTREAQMESVLSFVQIVHGDWAAVLDPLTRSVDIARRIGNVVTAGYGLGWKGIATFMLGQRKEGIELMKEGGKLIEATGSHLTLTLIYGWLAESCAASGDVEDADLYASKVLERGLVSDKVGETMAHRALAVAASLETAPDWGKVEDHIETSIRISQERGERPNLGICYYRQGELLLKKGDLERAGEQLDQATALFHEMEMTWWAEQAEVLRVRIERGEPCKGFAPYVDGAPTV